MLYIDISGTFAAHDNLGLSLEINASRWACSTQLRRFAFDTDHTLAFIFKGDLNILSTMGQQSRNYLVSFDLVTDPISFVAYQHLRVATFFVMNK